MRSMRMSHAAALLAVTTLVGACADTGAESLAAPTTEQPNLHLRRGEAFKTSQPLQAAATAPGVQLEAVLTVGDNVGGSIWAPIPDGLGAFLQNGDVVVFANHELSATGPGYENARVSRIALNFDRSVRSLSYPVDGSEGWQRLCSATWVGLREGFGYPGYFLTGEEVAEGRQFALAADGRKYELTGQGKFAHENAVAVPGFFGKKVLINLDDTRGSSELYMYVASDVAGVLNNTGTLYVFATDEAKNVKELSVGGSIHGEFIPVPNDVAAGTGTALQAWINARRWNGQAAPDPAAYAGTPIFPFVRLEDGDYEVNPFAPPTLYFVDTGTDVSSGTSKKCGAAADELCDAFGSVYRMVFNRRDPTKATLELLARSTGDAAGWASPDNVATSLNSLMVQEDPAYTAFARPARIYQFPRNRDGSLGTPRAVAEMVEDADGCRPGGNCWESSGIINVSQFFGPGSWLFDTQAHGKQDIPGIAEGGQLIFMKIPGS